MSGIELELQLRIVNKDQFEDIIKDPVFYGGSALPPKTEKYETTYYDTADHKLQNAGYSFRIRKSASGLTATVKEDGQNSFGLFHRGEWNRTLKRKYPSVQVFSDLPVGKTLSDIIGKEPLCSQFQTLYTRTFATATLPGGNVVELAANTGIISARDKTEEIYELELELASGDASGLFRLAAELSARYPLMPEEKNKYMRALALAGLTQDDADATCPNTKIIRLKKHFEQKEMSDLLENQLGEIIKKQCAFLRSPGSPETAHRVRTHVRRLRSVLYMMKPLLGRDDYTKIQSGLREYAALFSKLRELDVLIKKWERFFSARQELGADPSGFLRQIKTKRNAEKKALLEKIGQGSATPVFMETRTLIEDFRNTTANSRENNVFSIIRKRVLTNLNKFRVDYKNTDFEDPKAVHSLRIRCKKLNYSLGLLSSNQIKGPSDRSEFKKLQKKLGNLCDITNQINFLKESVQNARSKSYLYALGTFIGYQAAAADLLRGKLQRTKI